MSALHIATRTWLRTVALMTAAICLVGAAGAASPAITAGGSHTAALHADGTARAWGSDRSGELGIGTSIIVSTPRSIPTLPPLRAGLDAISAGAWHALVIAADGRVLGIGWNRDGQLGNGSRGDSSAPVIAEGIAGAISVAAAVSHSAAVTSDGSVWTWGANYFGELGNNDLSPRPRPTRVAGLSGFTAIAAGAHHTVGLRNDGTV